MVDRSLGDDSALKRRASRPPLIPPFFLRRRGARAVALRLDHSVLFLPCLEAAVEGVHVFKAVLEKRLRHTGARCFVRSRAIDDDAAVAGDVAQSLGDVIDRNAQ